MRTNVKKILSVILCIALALVCAAPAFAADKPAGFGAYDRVFIIGVDGAGRFFRDANTPNFDRIFKNGAVDYTAMTETITVSAQNWGSMLTGVSYIRHGLTNEIAGSTHRTSDTKYPTIFKYVRDAYPDAVLASIVNWNAINYGIIEEDLGVYKTNPGDDAAVTDAICAYFDSGNAPKLFFSHFDGVDHVGHELGSKAPEFFAEIEKVDGYIGRIYDSLKANGLLDNALFIVVSDHGHTIAGGHGGLTKRESDTTVAAVGKTVKAGGQFDADTRDRDVSAMTLYALGIDRPDYMSSRLPGDVFEGVSGEIRSVKNDLLDAILSRLARIITLCTAWI